MEDPVYLADELVLSRMLTSEARQQIDSYFDNRLQRDFNENDRRELAIWMRDVCQAEECQPDIFSLSMMIVDRFLSFVRTKRTQLQLLGSVALLLASKLRQTNQIPAQHLVYYTQDLISLRELWDWEMLVLTTLKWDLALITPVDYLDILIKRVKSIDEQLISDIEQSTLQMITDSHLDFTNTLYPPSAIAWACLLQAMDTYGLCIDQIDATPMPDITRSWRQIADRYSSDKYTLKVSEYYNNEDAVDDDHNHHHLLSDCPPNISQFEQANYIVSSEN